MAICSRVEPLPSTAPEFAVLDKIVQDLEAKNTFIQRRRKKKRPDKADLMGNGAAAWMSPTVGGNTRGRGAGHGGGRLRGNSGYRHSGGAGGGDQWKRGSGGSGAVGGGILRRGGASTAPNHGKKLTLILNSVIGSNTSGVCDKIESILQAIPDTEERAKYIDLTVEQLVNNAILQSLYGKAYVTIMKRLSQTVSSSIVTSALDRCEARAADLQAGKGATKAACKGTGQLYAQLYLAELIDFDHMHDYMMQLIHVLKNQKGPLADNSCSILVFSLNVVMSEQTDEHDMWIEFVQEHLRSLWQTPGAVSMRNQICLMDLKDQCEKTATST